MAGTIPAWDGGIPRFPTSLGKSGYADPFPNDKPCSPSMRPMPDKYKDNLTPGQMAMLKQYPNYKLNVYQTRRTAAYPEKHYAETKDCASKAKLAAGGNGVVGCMGGTPFPIPKNGNRSHLEPRVALQGRYVCDALVASGRHRRRANTRWSVRIRIRPAIRQLVQAGAAQREPNKV